ncbi:MAG TPA: methionyl-tRNA formyltransferase [Desulfomonilia bacterium]
MKLIFMGTPEFALPSLKILAESEKHEVALVITQPDKPKGRGLHLEHPPVKIMAIQYDIPVMQPQKIKGNMEVIKAFEQLRPDAAIVVAYGRLIPPELLSIPPKGFINVHASLLPALRGASPINHAILSGGEKTGISIMKLDEGLDTGPVYESREIEIGRDDAIALSKRLSATGAELLESVLDRIESGSIKPVPQDESAATYAPLLKKEDGLIDWNRNATKIESMVRGLLPWPCAYTDMQGKMLKILSAQIEETPHGFPPGTMIKEASRLRIACGNGFVIPQTLQLEGKQAMDAKSFANGLKVKEIILGGLSR